MPRRSNASTKDGRSSPAGSAPGPKTVVEADSLWLGVWARALRLHVLLAQNPEFTNEHDWWTESFSVDAEKECFSLYNTEGVICRANLQRELHLIVDRSLATGEQLITDYLAEKERQRQAELERQRLIKQALAKLTDEEVKALGITRPLVR